MAYLFNSAADDSEDTGKQNIFGGDPQQQGGGQQSDAIEKTNQGATGGGSGGGTSVPKQTSSASAGYNPKAASESLQKASQSINLPSGLGKAQGALDAGSKQLQDKANAYGQKAQEQAKTYEVSDETLKGAASGQKEAYESVGERLRSAGPGQFEQFGGLGEDSPNVDYIKDPGRLFASEAGPNYSAGQSRFDAAMLRRNPQFVQQQQQILANQKKLGEADLKAQTDRTAEANQMLGGAFNTATDSIKNRLGGLAGEVTTAAQAKEKAEDTRRAALDPKRITGDTQAKIKQQIQDDLKGADPRSAQARSTGFLQDDYDLSPYATIDRDTDWHEFLTDSDTGQYNRIQGLLGNSDMLTAGKGPGEAFSVNEGDAYKSIMGQLQSKRAAKDTANQSEIAAIKAGAEGRAKSENERLGQSAEVGARNDLEKYLQELNDSYQGSNANQYSKASRNTLNDFFTNPEAKGMLHDIDPTLDWKSVLSQDEAQQLANLSDDTGLTDQYSVGQGAGNEYDIDALKNLYRQKVQDRYDQYQGMI